MCRGDSAVWALFPIIWNCEYRMAVALKFGRQELYAILKMVLLKWYDNFVTERVFLYKTVGCDYAGMVFYVDQPWRIFFYGIVKRKIFS